MAITNFYKLCSLKNRKVLLWPGGQKSDVRFAQLAPPGGGQGDSVPAYPLAWRRVAGLCLFLQAPSSPCLVSPRKMLALCLGPTSRSKQDEEILVCSEGAAGPGYLLNAYSF